LGGLTTAVALGVAGCSDSPPSTAEESSQAPQSQTESATEGEAPATAATETGTTNGDITETMPQSPIDDTASNLTVTADAFPSSGWTEGGTELGEEEAVVIWINTQESIVVSNTVTVYPDSGYEGAYEAPTAARDKYETETQTATTEGYELQASGDLGIGSESYWAVARKPGSDEYKLKTVVRDANVVGLLSMSAKSDDDIQILKETTTAMQSSWRS
jgi:hypothetical protein